MEKVDTFKTKILRFFASDVYAKLKEKENDFDMRVNQRVGEVILQMDPLLPLLKKHSVIFSEEFTKVEEKLDEPSRLGMAMWAWGQKRDPYMKRMIEWVMNNAGNETIKRAPITAERTQYGRAQIANMVLFRDEIGRLSSIYEEIIGGKGDGEFDDTKMVE